MSKLQMVAICELKVDLSKFQHTHMKIGMDTGLKNSSGSVWLFFQNSFSCSVVGESDQHFLVKIWTLYFSSPFILSFVHAKCMDSDQRQHLNILKSENIDNISWLIGGDFNVIVQDEEKK